MEENIEKRGYLSEYFRFFHLKDSNGTEIAAHYHDFYKIVMLISGNGEYVVEGRRYILKSGDIVLVKNNSQHKPYFKKGYFYERFVIYISPEFILNQSKQDGNLDAVFSGIEGHVLRPGDDARRALFSIGFSLEDEIKNHSFGSEMYSIALLSQLLIAIHREKLNNNKENPNPVYIGDTKILDILSYIDQNYDQEINIDDLASLFYISKYHMMRRFKAETGTSIHNYMSDKRLGQARNLIQCGVQATEACYQSGYKSYSTFARAYEKRFSETPTGKSSAPLPYELPEE